MDDSVIKVLRRNGSWKKTNKLQGTSVDAKKDFSKLNSENNLNFKQGKILEKLYKIRF